MHWDPSKDNRRTGETELSSETVGGGFLGIAIITRAADRSDNGGYMNQGKQTLGRWSKKKKDSWSRINTRFRIHLHLSIRWQWYQRSKCQQCSHTFVEGRLLVPSTVAYIVCKIAVLQNTQTYDPATSPSMAWERVSETPKSATLRSPPRVTKIFAAFTSLTQIKIENTN